MGRHHTWIKEGSGKKRMRILAVALSVCVLVTTYPDILTTLSVAAAVEEEQTDVRYISAFAELPEEIREQTVPAGTGWGGGWRI